MRLQWMSLAVAMAGFGMITPAAHAASNAEYLATRAKTKLTTLASTQHLNAQLPAMSGQVVELQGTINGVINGDDGTGYLLRVDEDQTLFLHAKKTDSDLMVGNQVRVMVRPQVQGVPETVAVTKNATELTRADFATLRLEDPSGTTNDPFAGVPNPGVVPMPEPVITRKAPALQEADTMAVAESQLPYLYDGTKNRRQVDDDSDVLYNGRQSADVQRLAECIRNYNSNISDGLANKIAYHIADKSERYGVDPWLTYSLVAQESRFNPNAVSPVGAQGLGQLMPGTAASLGIDDPFDIEQNLDGAVRYLSQQLRSFGKCSLALAAYNAGPGNVRKYGGVPPFRETQHYVKVIWNNYRNVAGDSQYD